MNGYLGNFQGNFPKYTIYALRTPSGFKEDQQKVLRYLEWTGKELGVNNLEDWYHISIDQVSKVKKSGLLRLVKVCSIWINIS